jgi:hypothetical protein
VISSFGMLISSFGVVLLSRSGRDSEFWSGGR